MGKQKDKKKGSQLVIRVEKEEKAQFLDLCETLDTSAGREIRRFMREFVAAKAGAATPAAEPAPKPEPEPEPAPVAAAPAPEAAPEAAPVVKKPGRAKKVIPV